MDDDAIEASIAADPDPAEHPADGVDLIAAALTTPAEHPAETPAPAAPAADADDWDPYADDDDRRAREVDELRRGMLEHELFAAFPRLRNHPSALLAAAAEVGDVRATDRASIAALAKKLGTHATRLIEGMREDLRKEQSVKRISSARTAGVSGASMPPGIRRKKAEAEPVSLCQAIRARQQKFRLY